VLSSTLFVSASAAHFRPELPPSLAGGTAPRSGWLGSNVLDTLLVAAHLHGRALDWRGAVFAPL